MSYFLCGETGIINRGCEAIIRSTVKVLNKRSGDVYLATEAPEMDRNLTKELGINLIKYNSFPTKYHRYYAAVMRRIKHSVDGKYLQAELFSHLSKDAVCLNIGGDTYCYGRPSRSIELNKYTFKKNIPNILWCCSIEQDVMKGEILKDLKKYRYIFAREELTYRNLLDAGIETSKVIKCCDPAFFLDKKEVKLPEGFICGKTIGLNVSEIVIDENKHAYDDIISLVKEILEKTDMTICLIPHVYSIEQNKCDWPVLNAIYQEFNCKRVCIVNEEYNCEQLKYIISKCRFLVAARTHASIAAYSSEIPTLVLGYSVKSKGIAQDLFGTYTHFVLPCAEITSQRLSEDFWYIFGKESEIRERLRSVMPNYKKQLLDAIEVFKCLELNEEKNMLCDYDLCTGCQACRAVCPLDCISMKRDSQGFLYPKVDTSKCVGCGKCRNACPVVNRVKDDLQIPDCYIAFSRDNQIRKSSSSGGVYAEIARSVIEKSGVVFGAAMNEKQQVFTVACGSMDKVEKTMGSKYVQADVGNSYKEVASYLKKGTYVLYSGTPCQIGGLYAYLGCEYDNLITVDLICHGVPSPRAWTEYTEYLERKYKSKIKNISFRCKDSGWRKYSLKVQFDDKSVFREDITKNIFLRAFISHLILRPSCYCCSFKQVHRQADITLGDFWAANRVANLDDDKGISVLLAHSAKGKKLVDLISKNLVIKSVGFQDAIKDNSSYEQSAEPSAYLKLFNKRWNRNSFPRAVKSLCEDNIFSSLYNKSMLLTNWKWK